MPIRPELRHQLPDWRERRARYLVELGREEWHPRRGIHLVTAPPRKPPAKEGARGDLDR